ncbi:MAG: hypothetical protein ABIH23_11055 [bacterium]
MHPTVWRYAMVISFVLFTTDGFAQEGMTFTDESGRNISVSQDTLVDFETDEDGEPMYTLRPSDSAGLASVTISTIVDGKPSTTEPETRATGKRITIWLKSDDETNQARVDFKIEGEGLVLQGSDRMYGPEIVEFKDLKLTVRGKESKDGDLLYAFGMGRIDWKGQEFVATFELDKDDNYVLKTAQAHKKNARLNIFNPSMKGGVGHLIPTGQPSSKEASSPERKVSPSK